MWLFVINHSRDTDLPSVLAIIFWICCFFPTLAVNKPKLRIICIGAYLPFPLYNIYTYLSNYF